MNRGFTIMTTTIVAKYGNFNQSTLLTDTAYDIALVLRLAQTYGLSVKNAAGYTGSNFNVPYGVDFNDAGSASACGVVTTDLATMTLFADSAPVGTPDGVCTSTDANIDSYKLTRGAVISSMCVGSDVATCHGVGNTVTRMSISYQRPNPEAVICASSGGPTTCTHTYAEVTIRGTDGSLRTVVVRQNGQVSVAR